MSRTYSKTIRTSLGYETAKRKAMKELRSKTVHIKTVFNVKDSDEKDYTFTSVFYGD